MKASIHFIIITVLLALSLIGCKETSEELGKSQTDHDSVYAWIWAYDSTNSKIRAYKFVGITGTSTPALEEDANAHANMHIMTAGGENGDEPAQFGWQDRTTKPMHSLPVFILMWIIYTKKYRKNYRIHQ